MTSNAITKTFHYDGDLVTYVTQSDGKVYRFSYDHSGRPIFISYNNNQYWYHYDQHGSVIRMTDKDGKTVAKYKYDAWGNSTYKWGTTGTGSEIVDLNPYRYSGYWYDSEIDKYYHKARYYDAEIGRFLAKDPIAVRIGDSLSLNAYSYAGNNPVMFVDPSGEILAAWLVPIVAGALIGMAIDGGLYLWSVRDGGFTLGGFAIKVIEGALSGAIFYGGLGKYFLESGIFIEGSSVVKGTSKVDANKLNHLFGNAEHNFDALLKFFGGNQSKAYTAIENAAQSYVTKNNITGVINASNQITVKVLGYNVTVRGNVIDGVLRLGTAFIKP